jgi:cytochrome c-type biogenesis protein CcmH/NrfF
MIGGALPNGLLATVLAMSIASPPTARHAHVSAVALEKQLICVTCKIPLPEANSPQAEREKAYVRQLVSAGLSERQIKNRLVAEYGSAVLALPKASGINLAVYIVPPAVVLLALAGLALAIPRWRRRGREAGGGSNGFARTLSSADAARLEKDMARFDP